MCMVKDYSPFTPGHPVPVEYFVGRRAEIERLVGKVRDAVGTKRMQVAFLSGDRGLGKSSLATMVRGVAEKDLRVLGLPVHLGSAETVEQFVAKVIEQFVADSRDTPWYERVRKSVGHWVKEVGLFGMTVSFDPPAEDLARIARSFVPTLRGMCDQVKDERRGLLLVLDDINGLASEPKFAQWLKSLVDEVATRAVPMPVALIFVGLDERRQALLQGHPSLDRVLDPVPLQGWKDEETREFFTNTFSKAGVQIQGAELELLVTFSGGYPAVAQEIGDAVFWMDTDRKIGADDAEQGLVAAADIVGRKFLQPKVYEAIRSEKYRSILHSLAKNAGQVFVRKAIKERLRPEEARVLDNFLDKMKNLDVLRTDPLHGPGAYRFSNELHRLYFLLEAERSSIPE